MSLLKEDNELWDIFTRKEEYDPLYTDEYERFPYELSKYKNTFEPIVSEFLLKNGFQCEYPDGKKFAVCLTHDIDVVYPSNLAAMYVTYSALKAGQFINTLKTPLSVINKRYNPYWNFEKIINLENKYNAKSSFYFLSLDPDETDYNYKIEDLGNEISNISDKGWEVGLHGGHSSYNNLKDLEHQKIKLEKILGKKVVGYRNHFLRFKVPVTWELLAKAGFSYDSTLGYSNTYGFRNGMCHPFKPFNLETKKEIDILEIPLNIMDATFHGKYLRFDQYKAWDITKKLIDTVEKNKGVLTILWHNTFMLDSRMKFYEKILKYCYEKGAYITSGEEICSWWKHNIK